MGDPLYQACQVGTKHYTQEASLKGDVWEVDDSRLIEICGPAAKSKEEADKLFKAKLDSYTLCTEGDKNKCIELNGSLRTKDAGLFAKIGYYLRALAASVSISNNAKDPFTTINVYGDKVY